MRKIRIESKGTMQTTHVIDYETGKRIPYVLSLSIQMGSLSYAPFNGSFNILAVMTTCKPRKEDDVNDFQGERLEFNMLGESSSGDGDQFEMEVFEDAEVRPHMDRELCEVVSFIMPCVDPIPKPWPVSQPVAEK